VIGPGPASLLRIFRAAVAANPKLRRGRVWCTVCGRRQDVDAVRCLCEGWPACCGLTMTIDSPAERAEGGGL